jgi:hypothetical protein
MNRRQFLALPALPVLAESPARAPIGEPHFPSRLHQFVWRNWELANLDRLAAVLHAPPAAVLELGASLGLPPKPHLTAGQLARTYITAIRQNWHLLPEPQLVELLGWDRERFRFTLKEDDFLDVKLGLTQPACPELRYHTPAAAEVERAAAIRATVRELFGASLAAPGEPPCHFVSTLSDLHQAPVHRRDVRPRAGELDLTRGWGLTASPALADAGERFRTWLREAVAAELSPAPAARNIRLAVDAAAVEGAEGYRIDASARTLAITGHDRAGVLQAIYELEDRMERRGGAFLAPGETVRRAVWNPRYLYSYFALYGDPLLSPGRDPFPDGYLEKLARRGINGVWMQAVLNTLAPSARFPEFGRGWETRLRTLQSLVERAARYGVRVFLYLNEPRAIPAGFFARRPELRGTPERGNYALCTSAPEVREWLGDAVAHVVRHVPELGGFFTITMSENLTNCFSHGSSWGSGAPQAPKCPRCSGRESWTAIAELLRTLRDGVRRHSATAEVIAWDWGWGDALAEKLIPLLPRDVKFLSLSEWDAPVRRGGVETKVGEYSISVTGPGPRAAKNWQRARAASIAAMAKVQLNNTWEISAVPYIPVPHLIAEHCENLTRAGIAGLMASWTCGGYPSPNLEVARAWYFDPRPSRDEVLREVAVRRYGEAGAAQAVEAWRLFSEAFREFPYGVSIYVLPVQHGPANLLRLEPAGYRPSMILFPQDGYRAWCGAYPPEVVERQFAKLAAMWQRGLAMLERATSGLDAAIAATCYHHFRSVALQVEFYRLRERAAEPGVRARMRAIAEEELELARRQYPLARRHSEIGYEASNHYYYRPLDLVEKALNCRWVLEQLTH